MAKDYYDILGVAPDATLDQIKSAYRRRAKKLHPDHYGKDCDPFLEIQKAYEVLSDPARRRTYDRSLTRDQNRRTNPLRPRRAPVEPLIPRQEPTGRRAAPLDGFFRQWNEPGGLFQPHAPAPQHFYAELRLTPTQALHGGQVRVRVPVQRECPDCWGKGRRGFYACRRCSGTGVIQEKHSLLITFPGGLPDGYTAEVTLDDWASHHLTICFRVPG